LVCQESGRSRGSAVHGRNRKEGIKKDGKVVGIKTSEGDEIFADVVIAADGVNSLLGQQLGLLDEWTADEVALGVKEVLALPAGKNRRPL
jgi:electron transfer flavoprotein-quinone oxidoreductase